MKPIALAVVILIGIFLQAQTIKETADWLSSFVAKKATVIDGAGNWRDTYTVELNESKQLIITHQTNDVSCFKPENRDFCPSSHKVYTTTFKQRVNLSDIDPKSIGYDENFDFRGYTVTMSTTNLRNVIAYSVSSWAEDHKWRTMGNNNEENHEAYLVVQDEQSAKRIVNALRHAVNLAGGKPSPF